MEKFDYAIENLFTINLLPNKQIIELSPFIYTADINAQYFIDNSKEKGKEEKRRRRRKLTSQIFAD